MASNVHKCNERLQIEKERREYRLLEVSRLM